MWQKGGENNADGKTIQLSHPVILLINSVILPNNSSYVWQKDGKGNADGKHHQVQPHHMLPTENKKGNSTMVEVVMTTMTMVIKICKSTTMLSN